MESIPPAITLRPFELADVDDFIVWAGDDRVMRNVRWETITSKQEALKFIAEICVPHPWLRSICLNNHSIGVVSVNPGSGDDRCKADIGYAVGAENWGKGIATMAVKLAVRQVLNEMPQLVRLQAFVYVENLASQRVLEKAGFQREGLLRKFTVIKGILRDLFVFSVISQPFNRPY